MKKTIDFGSVADLTANNFHPNQIYQFWLTKKNFGSSYADDKRGVMVKKVYPTSRLVKLEENISWFNPKTSKYETVTIRHCVGESEIFKHLQSPDDRIQKTITHLELVDGHKMIRGSETTMLRYLALSNYNGSNPNRDTTVLPIFYLYDGNAAVEKAMEAEDATFELQALIRDPKNIDMLTSYARVILPPAEFDKVYGKHDQLKFKMLGLAKGDPKRFKEELNNPATLKKHYILESIDAGILYVNENTNGLYFRKNGELIQQAPMGLSPINLFVDKVTEDRTGGTAEVYKMILNAIHKDAVKIEVDHKIAKINEPTLTASDSAEKTLQLEYLFKEGKTAGLIIKKGSGFSYRDKWAQGEKGFIQLMSGNPELVEMLKIQLQELVVKE